MGPPKGEREETVEESPSAYPEAKTENNSNAQNAARHRTHVFFPNVRNALRGEKYLTAPARNCIKTVYCNFC